MYVCVCMNALVEMGDIDKALLVFSKTAPPSFFFVLLPIPGPKQQFMRGSWIFLVPLPISKSAGWKLWISWDFLPLSISDFVIKSISQKDSESPKTQVEPRVCRVIPIAT